MEKRDDSRGYTPNDNIIGTEFPLKEGATFIRYSDEELKEFREIVSNRLAEAKNDYDLLRGTLTGTDDNGTNDTSPAFKNLEDVDSSSKEEIAQLVIRQKKLIESLQNALIRIENKTYGICRISGKLIARERLRSVPHTTLCIDAKLEMSRIN
jgi:RNA polymerase-binding transcription factor DksA